MVVHIAAEDVGRAARNSTHQRRGRYGALLASRDSRPLASTAAVPGPVAASKPRPRADDTTQFSLSLRKSLRKQLAKLASDSDMTLRAFVLNTLRRDDLTDMRKERH
jgi:hypothetical protein